MSLLDPLLKGGGPASELQTTGDPVNVSEASPPNPGDVLTAVDATHAEWAPSTGGGGVATGLATTGDPVDVSGSPPPGEGDVLVATGDGHAVWQGVPEGTASALATNAGDVSVSGANPPVAGQVLTAVSDTQAEWRSPGLPSLEGNHAWYCDAATGSDSAGDGSAGAPWQSLPHALTERARYGDIVGRLSIRLVGAGPYAWVDLRNSRCGPGGRFEIRGDLAGVTFLTATITAITLPAITIDVAMTASQHVGTRFLRVLTGACAGAEVPIAINTTDTITPCQAGVFNEPGKLLAVGDQIAIVEPLTELFVASGIASVFQCTGGSAGALRPPGPDNTSPSHLIQAVKIRANAASTNRFYITGSQLWLKRVLFVELSVRVAGQSSVQAGGYVGSNAAEFGLSAPNAAPGVRLCYGMGVCFSTSAASIAIYQQVDGCYLFGLLACNPTASTTFFQIWGGIARVIGSVARSFTVAYYAFIWFDVGFGTGVTVNVVHYLLLEAAARIQVDARLDLGGPNLDAIIMNSGSVITFATAANLNVQPSTTGAAYYAMRIRGMALVRFNATPAKLLGSTPGQDVYFEANASVAASTVLATNFGTITGPLNALIYRSDLG